MRHRFRSHQHLLYVPRAESPHPASFSRHRGTGRPSRLTFAAAAAALASAAITAGVAAGPTARAMAVVGHLTMVSDIRSDHVSRHSGGGLFVGGPAVAAHDAAHSAASPSLVGLPAPATLSGPAQPSAGARPPGSTQQSGGSQPSSGGKPAAAGQPPATASPPAPPEQPIVIYDSVQPGSIPANGMAATYATGKFAVPAAQMAGRPTIWIDAWGTDPGASVLDVEPGDATPAIAATWVMQKLTAHHNARARIYTMLAEWPAVQSAIATLPSWMQAQVRYWIADPTGVPHVVPGASATQWSWGPSYDTSTANPGF